MVSSINLCLLPHCRGEINTGLGVWDVSLMLWAEKWIVTLSGAWLLRSYLTLSLWCVCVCVFQKLKHTESDKLQVQIQAYLDNVFDVGALLEDAETKNAALERVEELEENMSHVRTHDFWFYPVKIHKTNSLRPFSSLAKGNVTITATWQGHSSPSEIFTPVHTVPSQHGIYYDFMLSLKYLSQGKTNR